MSSRTSRYFAPFKVASVIVLLLIAAAIIYAAVLSLKNWPGINV
jgi:hypothetical protein